MKAVLQYRASPGLRQKLTALDFEQHAAVAQSDMRHLDGDGRAVDPIELVRLAGRKAQRYIGFRSEELRTRVFRLGRDREFADSPLEQGGFEPLVPPPKCARFFAAGWPRNEI
jgi:hypothetical protein